MPQPTTPIFSLDPAVTEAFPLQVGATWGYHAHIEEELGGKVQVRDEIITERVITQTQQANLTIFTLERIGGLNPGRFYYLVWGNSVYQVPPSPRSEALQRLLADLQSDEPTLPPDYVFPLQIGASWGSVSVAPQANHWYEWYVEGQEDVDVPAGHFADCYRLVFFTNPDDTTRWFCPGVGLARLRYRHHGSVHNEDWELISYPGMTTALAYESGGDIWIIVRGQPPRVLLTNGSNPHLSPDGNRLLFHRPSPELSLPDLWLADFTCPAAPAPCQVNERRLIGPAEFGSPLIYDLAWSPDGRMVALTTGSNAKTFYSEDLWLVDVETGDYRQVLDDGGGVPCYSPDGAWIALNMPYTGYQHGQLSLIAADGSSYRPLFDYLFSSQGKWLPDGVLVAGIVRLAQTAEDMAELWQVPVVGEPVRLATIPAAHSFHWSADGQQLAYLADDPDGWLHIAQACTERSECGDGSESVAVPGTDERTWPHSWSLGGQFLAVIHDNQYFFVSDDPNPALIPMPAPFWLWLDDESYLTAEWITDDPQAERGHFEVSRAWLDGRREFLFEAESLNGLTYRP
jgi:hypothetical protein